MFQFSKMSSLPSSEVSVNGPVSLTCLQSDDLSIVLVGEIHNAPESKDPQVRRVGDFLVDISKGAMLIFEAPEDARKINHSILDEDISRVLSARPDVFFADKRDSFYGLYYFGRRFNPEYLKRASKLTFDEIVAATPLLEEIPFKEMKEWVIHYLRQYFDFFDKELARATTPKERFDALSGRDLSIMDLYVVAQLMTSHYYKIVIYAGDAHIRIYKALLEVLPFKTTYATRTETTPLKIDMNKIWAQAPTA